MVNHILLEVFCTKDDDKSLEFCDSKKCIPNYECLLKKCPFLSFTSHENSLCYTDENSEVVNIITLGGEMLTPASHNADVKTLWKEICSTKINEAYQDYMRAVQKEF